MGKRAGGGGEAKEAVGREEVVENWVGVKGRTERVG